MKFKILPLFLMACFVCFVSLASQARVLTEDEAVTIVKGLRSSTETTPVDYYIAEVSQLFNDTRCPIETLPSDSWTLPGQPKWLVFVDEMPNLSWEHSCTYYYLPKNVDDALDVPTLQYQGNMPPQEFRLKPKDVHYDTRPVSTPILSQSQSGTRLMSPNSDVVIPERTHVVIIDNGGYLPRDIRSHWTACSYLYQIIVNDYGIPPSNIHPIISTPDTSDVRNPHYLLDGTTYIPYTEYSFENVFSVLDSLSDLNRYRINHLFVFYAGHNLSHTDNYLLNYSNLQEGINKINAHYKNLVVCCGNSFLSNTLDMTGNAVMTLSNTLQHPGLIFLDNLYVNGSQVFLYSFPYYWLSAIKEENIVTGQFVNSDSDGDGHVSMQEAFDYVLYNDPNYNQEYSEIYSTPTNLASQLSFDCLPQLNPLYTRRTLTDDGYTRIADDVWWNSPDIWMRKTNDGITNQDCESLALDSVGQVHLYVRVNNMSNLAYQSGQNLRIYWSKHTLGYSPLNLQGGDYLSGLIANIPLTNIAANSSSIIHYAWTVPTSLIDSLGDIKSMIPVNIIALVGDTTYWGGGAQKKVAMLDVDRLTLASETFNGPRPYTVYSRNGTDDIRISHDVYSDGYFDFGLATEENNLYGNMFIAISEGLYGLNHTSQNMTLTSSNPYTYKFDNIQGCLNFDNNEMNYIGSIEEHLLYTIKAPSANNSTANTDKLYNLVLYDGYGNIVDGQGFRFYRQGVSPGGGGGIVGPVFSNGSNSCGLFVESPQDDAEYTWRDENGNTLGHDEYVVIDLNNTHGVITLQTVVDDYDGFASISLDKYNAITSITKMGDLATVKLRMKACAGVAVKITPTLGVGLSKEYMVSAGQNEFIINLANYPSGLYLVSLIVNDEVKNTLQISK